MEAPARKSGGLRRYRFRKGEHLKKRAEIRAVFKKGGMVSCRGAKLFFLARLPGEENAVNRFAVTFAKKYGCAVRRNRARRLCREAYRRISAGLETAFDLVALVYPGYDLYEQRASQLRFLFERSGLLKAAQ
jgi:ribonuclease P protein component